MDLPKPHIERCMFERCFEPPLPVMDLCWDEDAFGVAEHDWHFPDGILLQGPAPRRFGITIHRHGNDAYLVRVAWNRVCLSWESLTRVEIMTGSLALILNSLGTDVWHLLNQSIETDDVAQAA